MKIESSKPCCCSKPNTECQVWAQILWSTLWSSCVEYKYYDLRYDLPVSSANINKRNYFQHRTTNNNICFFSKIETASCRSFLIKTQIIFVTIQVFSFRTYYKILDAFWYKTRHSRGAQIFGFSKLSDFGKIWGPVNPRRVNIGNGQGTLNVSVWSLQNMTRGKEYNLMPIPGCNNLDLSCENIWIFGF